MSSPGVSGGYGRGYPDDLSNPFNSAHFLVRQLTALVRTMTLVKVQAVTTSDQVGPAGFVDVLPLVNMVDGMGNSQQHTTVHGLPFYRLQGGTNGVICDPEVGDIGMAVIADRDISAVKSAKAQANPGSWRQHDMADGAYLGTVLGATPAQYVRFSTDGIEFKDKWGNLIQMVSAGVVINGVLVDRSHNIVSPSGEVTYNGHTLTAHLHPGVTTGSGSTMPPTG